MCMAARARSLVSSSAARLSSSSSSHRRRQRHHLHSSSAGAGGFRWSGDSSTNNNNNVAYLAAAAVAASTTGWLATDRDQHDEDASPSAKQRESCGTSSWAPAMLFGASGINPPSPLGAAATTTNTTSCESSTASTGAGPGGLASSFFGQFMVRRQTTIQMMKEKAAPGTLEASYDVDWKKPIGEGSFGAVYRAVDKRTGEAVAVKKLSKVAVDDESFQREMEALLHIRDSGGHPNICGLRSHYQKGKHYYLVLDLIAGGEMFEHLCTHGAYSEADAARLIREVASALAFLHGLNTVHGDLKPENLMLSSDKSSAAVVKIVDFGSAQLAQVFPNNTGGVVGGRDEATVTPSRKGIYATPAYSPPEFLQKPGLIDPTFDMWALGVIIYIMLTGTHPFDLRGKSPESEIERAILSKQKPPMRKHALTAHLSEDALDLLEKLLEWDPKKRMTAMELLEDPWVRGETARSEKMADSDNRLAAYRKFKTKFEAKVFADMVSWSGEDDSGVARRTSLIERAFRKLDPTDRGYVTTKELKKIAEADEHDGDDDDSHHDHHQFSLSGFSDLLAQNMKNRYFPTGNIVYEEGDTGNAMYFINSGSIEVYTKNGERQVRSTGDFFGEGALLHPKKIRSASIRCLTPVHAIEISREYFEKYLASDESIKLNLREKDKMRKRKRAKMMLRLQQNMKEKTINEGEYVYKKGEEGKDLYVVEEGEVKLMLEGHEVASVQPGEMTGEHSLIFTKPRNIDALCVTDECKLQLLRAKDFYYLLDSQPALKEGIRDISFRRAFQKALCFKLRKSFPKTEQDLFETFQAIDTGKAGFISTADVHDMLRRFDPELQDEDVWDIVSSFPLKQSDRITWDEFRNIFAVDKKQ